MQGLNIQKTVAIHQPNFLPWIGFFHKILKADKFIFLDDAQMPKRSSWINRSQLLSGQKSIWSTIPISKYSGFRFINEISIAQGVNWKESYLNLLRGNYSKHPFFSQVYDYFYEKLDTEVFNLAKLNEILIKDICHQLHFPETTFLKSSQMNIRTTGTLRLCELVCEVGGNIYLCGGGSKGYLDEEMFLLHGLILEFQNFEPKPYPQYGSKSFVPNLSIVDLLMNCGFEESIEFIS